jgi:hypothetical protein
MEATDSFVVQLNRVAFFASDGNGDFDVFVDFASIGTVNDA